MRRSEMKRIAQAAGGPGVRVDSHLYSGYEPPPYYDSLLAKVIVWAEERDEAIQRLERALSEMRITGPKTTIACWARIRWR